MVSEVSELYDHLTGLVGRALFHDRLTMAMFRARRNACSAVVMLLDVDALDSVVRRFGEEAGNDLLRVSASLLTGALRANDTVGRLEGDHFGIVLEDVQAWRSTALVADRLLERFAEPIVASGHPVPVKVHLGIAVFPQCGADVAALIERAGQALVRAKKRPGSRYEIDPPIDET